MPSLESLMILDRAKEFVDSAFNILEDVWHLEAALLSGATILSEASSHMASVRDLLGRIQLELFGTAFDSELEDDGSGGYDVDEWITAVVDVCTHTERAVSIFLEEAGKNISDLPDAVKRISTKPVDLFALHTLAIQMRRIQSQLHKIISHDAFIQYCKGIATAGMQPAYSPVLNIEEMGLIGYEEQQKSIIEKLLDISIPQCLQIAIVGSEGAGKTALVQKIYQSTAVKNHFDICFWLFDLNHFDYQQPELFKPIDILRKMLITIEPGNSLDGYAYDEELMIMKIRESLKVKRYLVAIDNVQRYNIFKKVLPSENNGSRVLIATRNVGDYERFCLDLDPEIKYQLRPLTYEEKLKLIFRKPIENKDSLEAYPPDVLSTARIVASSSWGNSPMNLVLSGGHILFNLNQPVSHNLLALRDIAATATLNEILTIIYNKLPRVLATCLAYTAALFPVNYLIHANSLIRLWIAEGLIPKEDERTTEETADRYLDELIQRGFVRYISVYYHNQANQPTRVVVIHPMLRSVILDNYTGINNCPPIKVIVGEDASDISGYYGENNDNQYSANFDSLEMDNHGNTNFEFIRRLALHSSCEFDKFSSFEEGKPLHGFIYRSLHSLFFFGSVAPLMFSEFKFLRVLIVFQARIRFHEEDRPCWLDGLINLRYMGFIVCWVESGSLGKKLSRLTNLRTLDLSESFVSGLSEITEHNSNVSVIGSIQGPQQCWSPVPDMT